MLWLPLDRCFCATCLQEEPPLIKAAKVGDAARVSRLLDNGHDPGVQDARGRTPYQLAASKEVCTI